MTRFHLIYLFQYAKPPLFTTLYNHDLTPEIRSAEKHGNPLQKWEARQKVWLTKKGEPMWPTPRHRVLAELLAFHCDHMGRSRVTQRWLAEELNVASATMTALVRDLRFFCEPAIIGPKQQGTADLFLGPFFNAIAADVYDDGRDAAYKKAGRKPPPARRKPLRNNKKKSFVPVPVPTVVKLVEF